MFNNQNNQIPRRRVRRYTPGHPGRAATQTVLILISVFLAGCIIGACVGIGLYRVFHKDEPKDTLATLEVIDPSKLNEITTPHSTRPEGESKLICIDPGHGFYDSGAVPAGALKNEADINMIFAKLLETELKLKGFEVVLTHDGVNFPHEYDYDKDEVLDEISSHNGVLKSERRDLAQSFAPDFFISIHCNTYEDPRIGGMVIYYENENTESAKAASEVALSVADIEKKYPMSVPAKAEGKSGNDVYAVTGKWGSTPAILAELGYLTSSTDSKYLVNDEWLTLVSKAYANAIAAYFSVN